MVPDKIEDLQNEITEKSVYEELYGYNDTTDLTAEQEEERKRVAKETYEARIAKREEQKEKEKEVCICS